MRNCLAKSVFIILLLLGWNSAAYTQENCDLTSKNAALLLNVRIGMSPEEAQRVFGKDLRIKVKKNGERTIFQNYIKTAAPRSLNDVRAIFLRFFEKKLYQVEIFYEPRPDLKTVEEIADTLALQLGFPSAQWKIEYRRAQLRCNNLSLLADIVLNPRIEITDETVRAKIEESRKKK